MQPGFARSSRPDLVFLVRFVFTAVSVWLTNPLHSGVCQTVSAQARVGVVTPIVVLRIPVVPRRAGIVPLGTQVRKCWDFGGSFHELQAEAFRYVPCNRIIVSHSGR